MTATDVEKLEKKELLLVAKRLDADLILEGKAKAKIKATLLQALAEKNTPKGTMRATWTVTWVKEIGIGRETRTERVWERKMKEEQKDEEKKLKGGDSLR